jgi:hypothetical protein
MGLRSTTAIAIGLSLAACACDKATVRRTAVPSTTRIVPVGSVHFDGRAGEQVSQMHWSRPGEWGPVRLRTGDRRIDAGLVSRDRFGMRLLTVHPTGGYDVRQLHPSCARRTLTIGDVRSADTDAARLRPGRTTPVANDIVIPPEEVARICTDLTPAMKGTPVEAAAKLRTVALKVDARRTEPGAADRAEAWKKYQAEHGQAK